MVSLKKKILTEGKFVLICNFTKIAESDQQEDKVDLQNVIRKSLI